MRIGCAGWTIPKLHQSLFPASGSHLQRYAQRCTAVEINSSFYRAHRPATYARWAQSVPKDFRFSVKVPKPITHTSRLEDVGGLAAFAEETSALGTKLGPWLVQLPPSLEFDEAVATAFLAELRRVFAGQVVCEPRHASWFHEDADALLRSFQVGRVAADPTRHELADQPGGWPDLIYYRLHGSPRVYYSEYSQQYLEKLASDLSAAAETARDVWCIFDNTALGAATNNALQLMQLLGSQDAATSG